MLHGYERDVRVTARKKNSADGPNALSLVNVILYYVYKSGKLFARSSALIMITKFCIWREHKKFIKGTLSERDEIYSRWQKIACAIQNNGAPFNNVDNSPVLLKSTLRNMIEVMSICVNFENQLKTELENYAHIALSQEYLKELSGRFKHLPQDMLEDLTSDKYSECL